MPYFPPIEPYFPIGQRALPSSIEPYFPPRGAISQLKEPFVLPWEPFVPHTEPYVHVVMTPKSPTFQLPSHVQYVSMDSLHSKTVKLKLEPYIPL